MIAVNSRGIVTLFNSAAERLTGVAAGDALGRYVADVIPNTQLPAILQSGKPELNQQQSLGEITIITNRVPVMDSEANVIGAVAVFRDITEMLALAEELTNVKQVQTLLEAIINATQDAITVVDENGLGILINPAYTALTGLKKEDVLNKPATVDIAEGESMHMKVLNTGRPVRGARMKVGPSKRDVIVNAAPILVNGKLKGSVAVIHDVSEIRRLSEELERARRLIRRLEARYTFEDIIGSNQEFLAAVEAARIAATTSATVLLRGPSGTGKELFAHAIHNASSRRRGPFVRVNCAALAGSLIESELFGYEEGAFTGAMRGGKRGLFEEASGGTIFLDEIGELDLRVQAKLLRVLQEKEIIRVGGTAPVTLDVRVIAATNAKLEEKTARGEFRQDLYYRLSVLPITIPPLSRRKEDIPALARHMLPGFNEEYGRNVQDISGPAMEALAAHSWPGNVRELENVLGRAIINMKYNEQVILPRHLPPLGLAPPSPDGKGTPAWRENNNHGEDGLSSLVERAEREAIVRALKECGGNKTLAAGKLKIPLRTFYYKLKKHGL
ncbi:MAG: sigma-54-dependent Fis family transcriptional regulator [Peptococcaceae bacterium]|nr:sigma-54-dependent Fis family transcriptional regulator [Peptococcaceae bacterium]